MRRFLGFIAALFPSIIAGAMLGLYPGYKAYDYVWKNAQFCTSCHVHDYANVSWEESAHGKLTTCHDCHHQPLRAYMRETVVMLLERPKFPKDLHHTPHIPKNLCEACHLSRPEDQSTITGPLNLEQVKWLPKVDHSVLHKAHLGKTTRVGYPMELKISPDVEPWWLDQSKKGLVDRPIICMDCHGAPPNRAHNFTAVDQTCLRCHSDVPHQSPLAKQYGCRSCHFKDFLAPPISPEDAPRDFLNRGTPNNPSAPQTH